MARQLKEFKIYFAKKLQNPAYAIAYPNEAYQQAYNLSHAFYNWQSTKCNTVLWDFVATLTLINKKKAV